MEEFINPRSCNWKFRDNNYEYHSVGLPSSVSQVNSDEFTMAWRRRTLKIDDRVDTSRRHDGKSSLRFAKYRSVCLATQCLVREHKHTPVYFYNPTMTGCHHQPPPIHDILRCFIHYANIEMTSEKEEASSCRQDLIWNTLCTYGTGVVAKFRNYCSRDRNPCICFCSAAFISCRRTPHRILILE